MPGTVWSTGTTQLERLGFRKYVLPLDELQAHLDYTCSNVVHPVALQWRRTSEAQPFELWTCQLGCVELWTTHLKHKQVELFLLVETTQSKHAQITCTPVFFQHAFSLFRFCRRFVYVRYVRNDSDQ
jgi:hypothetical protein